MNEQVLTDEQISDVCRALDAYYPKHMRTIDSKSFETKLDPVTLAINLRADVRMLEGRVTKLENDLHTLDSQMRALMHRPTIWRKIKRNWYRAKTWLRREEDYE